MTKITTASLRILVRPRGATYSLVALLLLTGAAFLAPSRSLLAAAPDAGSVIGNQATATYTDGSGQGRTATSNLVETIVAQVAGVDLEADQTDTASPGGTVYFPHTLENTGNGTDSYTLDIDEPAGDITAAAIYADADCNGVPDDLSDLDGLSTPNLDAGESLCIIAAVTISSAATAGSSSAVDFTATSDTDGGVSDTNTDTTNVTNEAVIGVTKAMDIDQGPSPNAGPITVTLTYTNTGNDTATELTLTDALPAGMLYVADSGRWSATGATQLTDASDGDEVNGTDGVWDGGLDFSEAGNTVTAIVESVAPGQSGTVRFQITIAGGLAPSVLENSAAVSYDDGSGTTINETTNVATYTVDPSAGVTATDDGSTADEDGAVNDVVNIQTAVAQGATVAFDNIVTNDGNGPDTFDMTFTNVSFPAGTTFQLFQSDGVTPMTDSNGNGIPDTGPVAAGASATVVLNAVLPPGANDVTTGGGPYQVTKTATSSVDETESDTVTDQLDSITASTVDLTNDAGGTLGDGSGPEVNPVTTVSVDPGQTATFQLYITNDSAIPDNYELQYSEDDPFAPGTLPAAWQVVFRNPTTMAVITNSGTIAAGATTQVTAEVRVPAGYAPEAAPGQSIYFRVVSSATGATDVKHDAVIVNEVHDLALVPNNTGQVFPGGAMVYGHALVNDGNLAETSGALTSSDSNAGWSSVIYYDSDGNGVIDPTDPVVDDISDIAGGVPAAGSISLLVKVFAPAGAEQGDVNVTTVSVDDADFDGTSDATGDVDMDNNTATETTGVISGDVTLEKKQALDAGCDGTPDGGSYVTGQITDAGAVPGACVLYEITVTNTGSTTVTALEINDQTPTFTTYGCDNVSPQVANNCVAAATSGAVSAPALAGTGAVSVDVGDLDPGQTVVLTFGVKIDE